jgi:hypothetical protein
VKEEDLQHGVANAKRDIESEENNGTLQIKKHEEESAARTVVVPITCAICLDSYQEGETVVWSSNPDCRHAFHQNCILDYLVTTEGSKRPCPCCRQWFCDTTSQKVLLDDKTDKSKNEMNVESSGVCSRAMAVWARAATTQSGGNTFLMH